MVRFASRRRLTFWLLAVACLGIAGPLAMALWPVNLALADDGGGPLAHLPEQIPAAVETLVRLAALFLAWRVGLCTDWTCPNRRTDP